MHGTCIVPDYMSYVRNTIGLITSFHVPYLYKIISSLYLHNVIDIILCKCASYHNFMHAYKYYPSYVRNTIELITSFHVPY